VSCEHFVVKPFFNQTSEELATFFIAKDGVLWKWGITERF
jgi:hypothetical protein